MCASQFLCAPATVLCGYVFGNFYHGSSSRHMLVPWLSTPELLRSLLRHLHMNCEAVVSSVCEADVFHAASVSLLGVVERAKAGGLCPCR